MSKDFTSRGLPISDDELNEILREADADLASGIERATDTAWQLEVVLATVLTQKPTSMSDAELDAILEAADADLASGIEQAPNTARSRAAIADAIAEARRVHPAYRHLAEGA